ncbi:DoxX family protein [Pedobacter miscanthi]|uniref:DoxX family protein n=1 Tax=Pedobacter miscanthi TaxID=2259170 RepID=A0A366KR44_9SPHI|nr:DoxX family protein [Pedobacter miscanthi]RBQ03649.1 DoxX family protein [Pedobacter miscanthi]
MSNTNIPSPPVWTNREKLIFRFFFLFFILQAIPLSVDFFKIVFGFNWLHISYGDIFNLSRLSAKFLPGADSFINWIIVAVIAIIGAVIWGKSKYKDINYDQFYYWLRVVVRYRLAIGIIGYGFIKFFPLQAPFPSISNLNTSYGDFTDWKIFSMSLGIVPSYESFLGAIEILAGLLLFFRKTATIGAAIILVFTGNVFISNLAYEGGEFVYATYLVTFALFVLWFDAQRIYNLVSLERPTAPNSFKPNFVGKTKTLRLVLKTLVIFFFVFLYGFKTYSGFHHDPYQFPRTKGLTKTAGIYNVGEFRINGRVLPYAVADSIRWKDVVFEKWATISVRSDRKVIVDSANYEQVFKNDKDRDYELAGTAGRHYYSYTVDSANHVLLLDNKNPHYKGEQLRLNYSRPDSATIILSGTNQQRDSIYVVLNKIDKKYPLKLSRRKALKL